MNPSVSPKQCATPTLSKSVCENISVLRIPRAHFQEGISIRIARIFNTYGPRMHMNDGRVVSNFVLQALQNDPITVDEPVLNRIRQPCRVDLRKW